MEKQVKGLCPDRVKVISKTQMQVKEDKMCIQTLHTLYHKIQVRGKRFHFLRGMRQRFIKLHCGNVRIKSGYWGVLKTIRPFELVNLLVL